MKSAIHQCSSFHVQLVSASYPFRLVDVLPVTAPFFLYCLSIFHLWWQALFPSSISIPVKREPPPPSCAPSCPPLCLFFLCLFLSFAAGSLFTGSSWREVFFFLYEWPQRMSGTGCMCVCVTLWLTVVTSDLLQKKLPQGLVAIQYPLIIYSDACSFLRGDS